MAGREIMLPLSLIKRMVNHARPSDVTEDHAPDWTVEPLSKPSPRITDIFDELMHDHEADQTEMRHYHWALAFGRRRQ